MPLNTGLPNPAGGVRGVISNFLMWLLGIFGFLGIIAFAISGFLYLTSAGNDDRIKTAKRAMNMALIGIVVGLSGMVAVYAIDRMLRGTNPFF